MSVTELATALTAIAGLLTVLSAYKNSARKSDLDSVQLAINTLQAIVISLQGQVVAANTRIVFLETQHLEDQKQVNDCFVKIDDLERVARQDKKLIEQLTSELEHAHRRLIVLEAVNNDKNT